MQRWKTTLTACSTASTEDTAGRDLASLGIVRDKPPPQGPLHAASTGITGRMRLLYEPYFDTKLRLKKKTPFGKLLVSHDLPRF